MMYFFFVGCECIYNGFLFVGCEYNCLIDGGHAKHLSNIVSCINEYDVMKGHGIQLHGIIVTHPDADHLNGVTELLEKHRHRIVNNYDVLVTEAFYWRSKNKVCTKFLKLMEKVYSGRDTIVDAMCLRPGLNCYFPKEPGCLFRCTTTDDKGSFIQPSETFFKENPKHVDVNETSILTVINQSERKCDAVLTGDSTAEEILPLVEGKEIGIFQVPHHGSSSNSRLKDKSKLVEYSGHCNLSIVNNDEVKEIVLFYSTFRARCYLISAGGNESYKHPHPYVLQGIILANILRHLECVIVLTNSRGLNSEKIEKLHVRRVVPQWTRYVKIYHYDDVFFTGQCHTSLRPEKCISDVCANTVEWTPEGYISRTRIMLPVKPTISDSRPLERNRFMEQSTVEITIKGTLKFSAHIICIPLPHNPRTGDSINCCYVIEESIAPGAHFSHALFLVDNDERIRSLSRAKSYVLFQYINNKWQKKQLPATVKDILPQTSPCPIPYDNIKSLWPVQDSSIQLSPSCTPHQSINFLQPVQNISPQPPPSHISHQSGNFLHTVHDGSPQTAPSHTPRQVRNSLQPVQNISPQTPPSHIPHQSRISLYPVHDSSPQPPSSDISYQSRNSLHTVHDNSPQTAPSHTPHQIRNSLQPVQNISPQTPPSHIPHQSRHPALHPVHDSSPQTAPSYTLHQSRNSHQLVQNTSSQTPPSHIPHQSRNLLQATVATSNCAGVDLHVLQPGVQATHQCINSLQQVLNSSPQAPPYSMQQLRPDINCLQIGSEGATIASSNCAGVHRIQAIQQSILRPPPTQYYGGYGSPTKGCRCQKTNCTTNKCGCKKERLYCGPNCQCSDCKNNQQYALHVPQYQPTLTPDRTKPVEVQAASPTKGCVCKTGCATRKCGCKKRGVACGPSCKCRNTFLNCEN